MKKIPMLLALGLLTPAFLGSLSSCGGKSADDEAHGAEDLLGVDPAAGDETQHGENDLDGLLLLDQSQAATLRDEDLPHDFTSMPVVETISPTATSPARESESLLAQDKEAVNMVIEAIDRSNQEQEIEIAKLKNLVLDLKKRLHEYRILNEDLKRQNQDLRSALSAGGVALSATSESDAVGQLKKELANLKNDFAMRTKDLYDSQEQARILQNKIEQMESHLRGEDFNPLVTEPIVEEASVGDALAKEDTGKLLPLESTLPSTSGQTDITNTASGGTGQLEFQAAITEASGKTREAFYTEFFVTKSHLDDILKNANPSIELNEGIGSYAELWARVRKNDYRYPGLQRNIRETLLAAVDADQGRRIRTDIDGSSPLIEGLTPGPYFIIGTAPLGQVGVTWSLPVLIERTSDKHVALTLNNSSWSQ